MKMLTKQEIQDWGAQHPTLKKGLLIGFGILCLWGVLSTGGDQAQVDEIDQRFDTLNNSYNLFDFENKTSDIDTAEANDVVAEMANQVAQQEKATEQKYLATEVRLESMQDQVASLSGQYHEIKQLLESMQPSSRPARAPTQDATHTVGANQYNNTKRVAGDEDVHIAERENTLSNQQTEIITRPSITRGTGIRTITQSTVIDVNADGTIDSRENNWSSVRVSAPDGGQTAQADSGNGVPSEEPIIQLALGSIISGTLINGAIAPTNIGGQDQPIPILMRIKREAIMPNHFSLDIRECHMLGAGIGRFSTGRLDIRAEAISCIRSDGKAIEQPIQAYAVSSQDGLTGVQGTIVNRNSKVIANAMERLAEYYLAMAEETWPVVEVQAGVEVTFIVQKGMSMNIPDVDAEEESSVQLTDKVGDYSIDVPSVDSIDSILQLAQDMGR